MVRNNNFGRIKFAALVSKRRREHYRDVWTTAIATRQKWTSGFISAMPDDHHSAISAQDAKRLFADWKAAPAIVLAVSGGPDSVALLWLAARWRRALAR